MPLVDLTHVDRVDVAVGGQFQSGQWIALGDAAAGGKIIGRAIGNDRHGGVAGLVHADDAVDHFAERAVTAGRHDDVDPLSRRVGG